MKSLAASAIAAGGYSVSAAKLSNGRNSAAPLSNGARSGSLCQRVGVAGLGARPLAAAIVTVALLIGGVATAQTQTVTQQHNLVSVFTETQDFNAVAGHLYHIDTTRRAITAKAPAHPKLGDTIEFVDSTGQFEAHNFTVDWNGEKFEGHVATILSLNFELLRVQFNGTQWVQI